MGRERNTKKHPLLASKITRMNKLHTKKKDAKTRKSKVSKKGISLKKKKVLIQASKKVKKIEKKPKKIKKTEDEPIVEHFPSDGFMNFPAQVIKK